MFCAPTSLTAVGSTLYFAAEDGTSGRELWKTDGTEAGTVRVRDIEPGSAGSSPNGFTPIGSMLYFTALDVATGRELWRSDGTESGTTLVRDVWEANESSAPWHLTAVGDSLFFTANDGVSGRELWKIDGASSGAVRMKDIATGFSNSMPKSSNPTFLTAVGTTLFFTATDDESGTELWKSDGTEAGTVRVKDLIPGANSSSPFPLTAMGSTVFFGGRDESSGVELWKSDGSEAGTVVVKDVRPGVGGSVPQDFTVVGSTLYFVADDGTSGRELWKTDGTEAGTVRVRDIEPGASGSWPRDLRAIGSTLYFSAFSSATGRALWKSDGTEAGTVLVKDIGLGINIDGPTSFTGIDSTVFFAASDGMLGVELWKTDGTEAGTVRVKDIQPGGLDSFPSLLTAVGSTLYFVAEDFFVGRELWKTDGTAAGTVPVKDIVAGSVGSFPESLTVVGSTLFFSADDGVGGRELWQTDGTEAGTVRVTDIHPGIHGSDPAFLTPTAKGLAFTADDGRLGNEVWMLSFGVGPSDITLSKNSIAENSPAGTVVGEVAVPGQNADGSVAYTLVAGPGDADNASFLIEGVFLKTTRPFNFEAGGSYSIRVRATDAAGRATEKELLIAVADVLGEPLIVEEFEPPAPGAFGFGSRVLFDIILSEDVTVRGTPRIEVQADGATRTATYVSGSGSPVLTFQYVVGRHDNADEVRLGDSFVFTKKSRITAGSRVLGARLPAGIAGARADGVRIDATPPRAVGRARRPFENTYTVGQSLDFTLRFSEAVIVAGVPRVTVDGFNVVRYAGYVAGSGTTELTFRYIVQAGDRIRGSQGLSLGTTIVRTAGARIIDAAGNDAVFRRIGRSTALPRAISAG